MVPFLIEPTISRIVVVANFYIEDCLFRMAYELLPSFVAIDSNSLLKPIFATLILRNYLF